ncbi:MAG TPA: DUF349 domain-containing protein, partial [Rubrivivax sp.]|nr:DUF349 domain-containing protein [Rubrivivax sp.]
MSDAQWSAEMLAVQGDDAALLRLALAAPTLDRKIACLQALNTEASLKQAEREFRNRDRKAHRLAKQRLEAAVAQREARATAQMLLQRTGALLGQTQVPVNHLVALDREWAALPAPALEPQQCRQFSEWRERIDATLREDEASRQRLQRWCADARRSLPEWRRGLGDAAERGLAIEVSSLCVPIKALCDASPGAPAVDELALSLAQLLQDSTAVEQRLAWLEAQAAPAPDGRPEPAPAQAPTEARARWDALPTPLDDELMRRLEQRFERAQAALQATSPAVAAPAPARPGRTRLAAEPSQTPDRDLLESLLQQAEAWLAEGQLSALQQGLSAIDVALGSASAAALPEAWRARHQALRAEHARLKGWQRWGGGRARDDLCAQADALAQHTLHAADASLPHAPKLNLKQHAQEIHALRQRWKELDRLGAAASLEMWQRFDAALQTAYQPVAAQHAALKAARQDNLVARETLLAALEALAVPPVEAQAVPQAMRQAEAQAVPQGEAQAEVQGEAIAWRELLRERDRFQLAWRKLGPIEHTAPAQACAPLQQRLRSALERIDTPLQQAQQAAAVAREALIARAQALQPGAGHRSAPNDAARPLRELQAEWQDQARRLPLPRALEAALWARFKAATDAVFAQRHAALAARDAELAAKLAAREALLERLALLPDDAPAAEIERALAQVDRAWRQGGELPRGIAEGLETRYRSARAAAAQKLDDGLRRAWFAQCDGLVHALQQCELREDSSDATEDPGPRPDALAGLPASWQQALAQRWARSTQAGPLPETEVDELLLQLEAALALPTPAPWQAARQLLKLRALKQALEGRGAVAQG